MESARPYESENLTVVYSLILVNIETVKGPQTVKPHNGARAERNPACSEHGTKRESNKANRAPRQSALLDVTLTHGQPGRPPERMNRADALSHLEMLALLLIILSQSGRNVKNK